MVDFSCIHVQFPYLFILFFLFLSFAICVYIIHIYLRFLREPINKAKKHKRKKLFKEENDDKQPQIILHTHCLLKIKKNISFILFAARDKWVSIMVTHEYVVRIEEQKLLLLLRIYELIRKKRRKYKFFILLYCIEFGIRNLNVCIGFSFVLYLYYRISIKQKQNICVKFPYSYRS